MGIFRKHFASPASIAEFRRHYNIPDDVAIEINRPETHPEIRDEDSIHIPLMAVTEGGVRFPLHPLLRRVLSWYRLNPMQISINTYRIIMGIVRLNELCNTNLDLWDINYNYDMVYNKDDKWYLKSRRGREKIVTQLVDSNRGNDDDFLIVSGNWEFSSDEPEVKRIPVPRRFGQPR
jgi:hypothetical protein